VKKVFFPIYIHFCAKVKIYSTYQTGICCFLQQELKFPRNSSKINAFVVHNCW
jgi:hypothetical protein